MGSIPGLGTRIPHAGKLSRCSTTTEPTHSRDNSSQEEKPPQWEAHPLQLESRLASLQLEKSPRAATRSLCMARKTQHSFVVVQPLSHVRLSATSWTLACQAPLSSTVSQKLLKFMSIESVMLSSHLIFCRPIFLLSSIFPSIRIFSNELTLCIRWPSIGVSASASVLLVNIQCWFPLGLTSLIALLSKGLSRVFSSTTIWKHQFFSAQPSSWSRAYICTWLLEKP